MWLVTRLKIALEGLRNGDRIRAEVRELAEAVAALERLQLAREQEWSEARDAIYRNLKRMQALKQHHDPDDGYARARQQVLSMKLNRNNGG